jgi:2-polyprenyl-3-methyl-5-hydroxy-6-metoxy-1,4-benzoquinol methylase
MAEKKCLVCGSGALFEHFSATDSLVSGDEFRIMGCSNCGFLFTSDPPDEKNIGDYYLSEDYISHTDRKRNLTGWLYHFARRFMLGRKSRLIARICRKTSGKLLDIGSGTGYFAAFMKEKGWTVKGVEISDMARDFAVSHFGLDVVPPDLVSSMPDKYYDCITLWHVLEHFYEPDRWMKEIYRLLMDDGRCILALPNIASSDARRFRNSWAALDVPRHLWHFAPDTLVKFIEKNGFRCTLIKGMPLDLFYISIISYKNCKARFAFIKGIATGIILSVSNLFAGNSSSSLIYVIEKRRD